MNVFLIVSFKLGYPKINLNFVWSLFSFLKSCFPIVFLMFLSSSLGRFIILFRMGMTFGVSCVQQEKIYLWIVINRIPMVLYRRRLWHPTPVLLPGNSHGQGSLVGCSPWGREESDMTERLHFHFPALEKEMATHSSVLAWRIPGTGEPGGLLSMGSHRVGHDWSDLAAAAAGSEWSLKFPEDGDVAVNIPLLSHCTRQCGFAFFSRINTELLKCHDSFSLFGDIYCCSMVWKCIIYRL